MVKIPVSPENLDFERLDLHRHYVVIDCDFTVYLILNPVGGLPLSGTDIAVINIGSWQIDAWKFLVRGNFPNEAGFSAVLAWDKTLVQDTEQGRKRPRITESDVDIADSVSSLKGQPVNITGFSLDDGKSLKVSTLENEFCNVRSFENWQDDSVKVFPTASFIKNYTLGDVLDVDKISQAFYVKVVDGKYHVYCRNVHFLTSEQFSTVIRGGDLSVGIVTNNASTQYEGCCGLYYVIFTCNEDNVITAIEVFIDGFVHEFAHQTPWHYRTTTSAFSLTIF